MSVISIYSNTRIRYLKPFQIIGWWSDTNHLINSNILIVEGIANIQNYESYSIHNCNSNIYTEWICMWLGPAQDVHFFYTRSHLSALQKFALIFQPVFSLFSHLNSVIYILFIELRRAPKKYGYLVKSRAVL